MTPGYELYELATKKYENSKPRKIKNKSFALSETLNMIRINPIALENEDVGYTWKSLIFMDFDDFGWYELLTPGYELDELTVKKYENSKTRKMKNKSFELSETLNMIRIDPTA